MKHYGGTLANYEMQCCLAAQQQRKIVAALNEFYTGRIKWFGDEAVVELQPGESLCCATPESER